MSTSKPCSTVTYAYKVYKTIDKRIDQIAIESIHIANVDVYVWSNDIRMAQYESYSSRVFAETYNNVRFRYIGNTRHGKGTYALHILFIFHTHIIRTNTNCN